MTWVGEMSLVGGEGVGTGDNRLPEVSSSTLKKP